MFKNMKLGTKIAIGFGVLIIISIVIGYFGFNGLQNVIERVNKADVGNRLIKDSLIMRITAKNYIEREKKEYIQSLDEKFDDIEKKGNAFLAMFNRMELKNIIKNNLENAKQYQAEFKNYVSTVETKIKNDENMVKSGRVVLKECEKLRLTQKNKMKELLKQKNVEQAIVDRINKADEANRLIKEFYEIRRHEKNFIIRKEQVYVDRVKEQLQSLISRASVLKEKMKNKDSIEQMNNVLKAANEYKKEFKSYVEQYNLGKKTESQMIVKARVFVENFEKLRGNLKQEMLDAQGLANTNILFFSVGGIILGIVLGFFIITGITKPIRKIINDLQAGSEQVASASEQVSTAAQNVAEAGAENASSIEETSSAVEEASSMVQQTADNATTVNTLTKDVILVVDNSNKAMNEMQKSMESMKKNSDEIAKIIKVIEEIAFQTNLLALNAAVEAARAGEHGKGFAVVAEEVRNLAQRAAAAAKETENLIEQAVKGVNIGMEKVNGVADGLTQITKKTGDVGKLIEGITNATNEQAHGITQINSAISEMDKVTQSVAANAEESASASEELSAQAITLSDNVKELISLIEGVSNNNIQINKESISTRKTKIKTNINSKLSKKLKAKKVIPMEEEFEEF
jgi:methyl-accepting chemotaxis protein